MSPCPLSGSCDETERGEDCVHRPRSGVRYHPLNSLLLSQNKYSLLGSSEKNSDTPLLSPVLLEFLEESNPITICLVYFLSFRGLDINLESKCSSILQQHLSGVQWTNPIATDWNFWFRNNPTPANSIWLSKVHQLKRPRDRQDNSGFWSLLSSCRMNQNRLFWDGGNRLLYLDKTYG